jgi:hypothetical protein
VDNLAGQGRRGELGTVFSPSNYLINRLVLASELTRLGVAPMFIGYTPSNYDTGFYFGQLATLAHLIKIIELSGMVVLVDEAAAITDLRSNSRRKAYKVVDEIIQNTAGFTSFYMVISYLPALITQLVRDCGEFDLSYLARWKSVLGPELLEVEPLSIRAGPAGVSAVCSVSFSRRSRQALAESRFLAGYESGSRAGLDSQEGH